MDVAWHLVPSGHRMADRLQEWFPISRSICAWYKNYAALQNANQYGGTAIIVLGHAVSRVQRMDQDESGMGRWCTVRLQGKDGTYVSVVSAYRPVDNKVADSSVYNQQISYYALEKQIFDTCPRQQFNVDIQKLLSSYRSRGDEVILGIDFNEETRDSKFCNLLTETYLEDAITIRHNASLHPSSTRNGRKKIDALCTSPTIRPIRSGSLGFVEGLSDHRPNFAIFQMTDVFGQNKPATSKIQGRRLKGGDPRTVKKYVKRYNEWLIKHGLYRRASELENSIQDGENLTSAQIKEFEYIDAKRIEGMKFAEKKCRTLFAGGVSWSIELQRAMDEHRYWELALLQWEGRRISAKRLSRLARKLHIVNHRPQTKLEILEQRHLAWQRYQQKKSNSLSLRGSWIDDLAAAKVEAGQEKPASAVKNLKHREKTRKENRIIKFVIGNNQRRAVSSVLKTVDGNDVLCNTQEEIESAGLDEFEERIRQSTGRPLQRRESISVLGPQGLSPVADEILATGKVPEELRILDPFLEDYLSAHARGVPDLISDELSTAAHSHGWKKPKEATSSGRSGIHFGHFKAGTTHANIAAFEAAMSSIPWRTGYSPMRWCISEDVMIEKKPGDYHVSRLRTIMLFEADFNQGNKILGRNLMRNAEKYGLLAPEQYGSRRSYTAINQGLNKRLTFDLLRQRKQRGALASTDAKSCYDCISHISAALAMRRVGASKPAVQCMLSTLQQIKHYIKSAFGSSVQYFDSDNGSGLPVHGVGQGNGAAPAIWALVSTPIFDSLRRRGHGVFLQHPISKELLHFVGYAFVDDTDLAVTDQSMLYKDNPTDLFDLIQSSVNLWEGFIRASGGAIRPDKSHWYVIDFEWNNGRWKYSKRPPPSDLMVRNPEGVREAIKLLPNDTGERTVGVRLAPDGNNLDELKFLTSTAKEWMGKVQTSRLPREYIWTSFTGGIMKKLQFPLTATTFTLEECEQLQGPLLTVALPSIGVNRHFPRVLAHGPKKYQGLEIPHLYVEQGLIQIKTLIDSSSRQQNITASLSLCSLEQAQLELGLSEQFFGVSYGDWSCLLTDCWLKCLWKFSNHYNLQLHTPIAEVRMLRGRDQMLMNLVAAHGIPHPQMLSSINRCRLFLGVARCSDLLSIDGRTVRRSIWDRQKVLRHNAEFSWPRQGEPSNLDWTRWESCLVRLFGLVLPLLNTAKDFGPQVDPTQWEWFYGAGTYFYVNWADAYVQVYQVTSQSRRGSAIQSISNKKPLGTLPFVAEPVDVVEADGVLLVQPGVGSKMVLLPSRIELPCMSLADMRAARVRHECSWIFQFNFGDNSNTMIHQCARALQLSGVEAVSDGSSKDGRGAAAWVMVINSETRLEGGFIVPGHCEDQDSYRSEAFGLLAIVTLTRSIVRNFHLTTNRIVIGCDGKSALDRCLGNDSPATMRDNHWDVVELVQKNLFALDEASVDFRHVYGHQDEKSTRPLDKWELLNIEMDLRAKWCRNQQAEPPSIPLFSQQWHVTIDGNKVVRHSTSKMREQCTGPAALKYWEAKQSPDSQQEAIAWDSIDRAMRDIPRQRRQWVCKQASGWCAVNKNMKRWNLGPTDQCPYCEQVESVEHMQCCASPESTKNWELACEVLERWLGDNNTQPQIREVLMSRLCSWRGGARRTRFHRYTFYGLQKAIESQDRMGWEKVLDGRLSPEWAHVQSRYYDFIQSSRSGERWLSMLITKLWDISWDLWDKRNKVNVERRERLVRKELEDRVREVFSTGVSGLLHKRRHLLERYELSTRLGQSTQTLKSWLLRIDIAKQEKELYRSESAQERRSSKRKRELAEKRIRTKRTNTQLRAGMASWLKKGRES